MDKGLWVLYLGVGMLEWVDSEENGARASSPLLLVPVTIARSSLREPFRLRRTEDDPVVNPALAVKLQTDFDLTLPTIDHLEDAGLDSVQPRVADLVGDRKGWSVSPRVVLSTFTFQKEAMYRDLLDNEDALAENAMVQLLALGPDAPSADDFDFEPVPEHRLDQYVPPEDLVSVRDADASQRRCILAARDGQSFVMDGPPGSGKSQTITNIIAELLHAGKTVLFVSEKAAALDVVHNRLTEQRLEEFTPRLHSHDANRKTVATEFGRALMYKPQAIESFTTSARSDLVKRREALSSYAQALNMFRQPLGRSLHEVLGRIGTLQSLPQAPVPSGFGISLEPDRLTALVDTAAALGRSWGPVTRGHDFLWRDLADATLSASRRNELERTLDAATQALTSLISLISLICEELGLGRRDTLDDARRLLDLLVLLDDRHEIPADWLTAETLEPIAARVATLSESSRQHDAVVSEFTTLVGDSGSGLDVGRASDLDSALAGLRRAEPAWVLDGEGLSATLRQVADFLSGSAARLSAISEGAKHVAAVFGIPADEMSVTRAGELGELGELVGLPTPPEPQWLNPAVQAALDEAVRVLGELLGDFRARQETLRTIFSDDVLGLDLRALHVRFTEVHRGLRKMRRAHREDKRTLAACTVASTRGLTPPGRVRLAGWRAAAIRPYGGKALPRSQHERPDQSVGEPVAGAARRPDLVGHDASVPGRLGGRSDVHRRCHGVGAVGWAAAAGLAWRSSVRRDRKRGDAHGGRGAAALPVPPRRSDCRTAGAAAGRGLLRYVVALLRSGAVWRQLLYHLLLLPLGALTFAVTIVAWSLPIALLLLPAYVGALPGGGADLLLVNVGPGVGAWLAAAAGMLLLLGVPYVVHGLSWIDATVGTSLLGRYSPAELEQRIGELETSRAQVLDAAALERRRIERDLHDGAQQQLVSLAMKLGRARSRFEEDPEAVRDLIGEAHQEAKRAIVELRDLTRGIHPPVLTDRGLDAALSALAARSAVPVTVTVDVPNRPTPTIEAIAYFVVAEAVTNIARHAAASQTSVTVRQANGVLRIDVTDDGIGGADPARGSGLAGLAGRASSVDGRVTVNSPAGGPTVVTVELPCAS